MKAKPKTKQELLAEIRELRRLLDEAQQKLRTAQSVELGGTSPSRLATDLSWQEQYDQLHGPANLTRSILDTSIDAIFICDEKGKIVHANQEALRQFSGELLHQRFDSGLCLWLGSTSSLHPEPFSVSSVLSGKTIRGAEVAYARDGGPESYFLLSGKPLIQKSKRILGCILSLTDITERKRIEQECERLRIKARGEKGWLEAVMDALPVGLVITDSRGGVIRSNKAYEQVWGHPRPLTASVSDYGAYKAWWSDTGKPIAPEEWASAQAVRKGQAVIGQMLEIERFDGSHASVINSGAPVFDESGKVAGCVVAIQDISDLRRAEQALHESEARTAAILSSISDCFMTLDNNLVVTYFNPAAEQLLKRRRGDVLGKILFEAFPEAKGSIFEERYTWALREKKATAFETYFGVKPYENWYDVRVYPHEYGISVYFRVITDQKKAGEAVLNAKEKYEILAETAGKLLATDKPQELVTELCHKVMTHLDCQAFFNYLVDPAKQRLHLNAFAGITEQTAREMEWLDYGEAVCGCAARDAARVVCENISTTPDPRTELVKSFGIKAYACHPLMSEGRVIGTLSFGTRSRNAFSEEDLSLMKSVADQAATAIERMRLIRVSQHARDELEKRVLIRTEELDKANENLKAERRMFYDVLGTIPAYVVLLTPDYYATFANRTFIERFGESHGRRCFEFLFERSEPCEVCETYSVLKTMAPHQWEWAGPDGRIYFVHDFPFTDADGSTLILEMGIDITERKQAEEELKKKEEQIRFFAAQCLTAQEKERRRIAVELHDSIASSLAGIKFRLEKTGEDMANGLATLHSVKEISTYLSQTLGEVRRIMADLRPSILDDLGILPALSWFCREYEKTYPHITVQRRIALSEIEVPDSLKTAMFRITQEAMTNIARHSQASLVNLSIQKSGETIALTVQDNGRGFQAQEIVRGFGLNTMQERAELSGGTFAIQSAEGEGTIIRASWPWTVEEKA